MPEKIVDAEGMMGNFERRRQIETDAAEARRVGRSRPRMRETTPGSRVWNRLLTEERLVDEKG